MNSITGMNGRSCLYVGDSMEDFLMAKKATILGHKTTFCGIIGTSKNPEEKLIKPGSVMRFFKKKRDWVVTQLPEVESALISMDPNTGAIVALVGGFSFKKNKYNHVTQAHRQPGSIFKPFIISRALEKGITPSTIINDGPLEVLAKDLGTNENWVPQNYNEKFSGPMRLREGLAKSKNLISIRILKHISPEYSLDYIARFGFNPKKYKS